MHKAGSVYIMSSPNRATLYTGVTSDLESRVWKHKNKYYINSFSSQYNCVVLVYYCHFYGIDEAIAEEKRIKGGSRRQKEMLIESLNPQWNDLWDQIQR